MIFVVLGTWDMPFVRPLVEIEKAIGQGLLREPILVQSGHTPYRSPHMTVVPFFDKEDLERKYEEAALIICQAGVGSIMLGLKKGKKVVTIARRASFDEHIDDHQLEILQVFSRSGAVLPWRGEGDLTEVLSGVASFVPAPYAFAEERISRVILDYLNGRRGLISL